VKDAFIDSILMSRWLLVSLFCLLFFSVVAQAHTDDVIGTVSETSEQIVTLELSTEERAWIKAQPVIRVGAEMDWPPFDHVEQNQAAGFSNDYLRLLAEKVGLKLEFVHGYTWSELLQMAKEKQLDALPAVWKNRERTTFLEFTQSYYESKNALVVREDSQGIDTLEHLVGKTLAAVKDYNITLAIAEDYPDIRLMLVDSPLEALVAVGNGSADAYVDQMAVVNYIRRKNLILGLKVAGVADIPALKGSEPLYITVRKDWPILAGILNKSMAAVTVEEYQNLELRWLMPPKLKEGMRGILLTSADKQFLSSLGTLRIGIEQQFHPLEFVNEAGQHRGLSSDYVRSMGKQLGLEVALVVGATQQQLIEKLQDGEIDMLPGLHKVSGMGGVSHFTRPYAQFPLVIATLLDVPHVRNLDYLKNQSVGVVHNCVAQSVLTSRHPELDLHDYPTLESAMLALEGGEVSAVIDNSAAITYQQRRLGLATIKVIPFSTPYAMQLSMGVREGLAPLAAILDRMIAGMSQNERNILADKWVSLPVEMRTDWQHVWQAVFLVAAVAMVIIFVIMIWNRRLANEIAEREQLEKKLIEARRVAEEASRAKSEFVATLSHEIRTPMNGVLGMTYLLNDTELDEEQKQYLGTIDQSGHALMAIINDILDFSKIEAGKMRLDPIPFDLEHAGHEVVQLLAGRAEEKGLQLIMDFAPGCPRNLVGDPGRIRQILINLLGNAIKFTDSGFVLLRMGCAGMSDNKALLHIAVEDTGVGISDDDRQRLFDSFTQLDNSSTRRHGGTGLGLTICKRLVSLMGGEIGIESEGGKGSVFWLEVSLPLADVPHPLPKGSLHGVRALAVIDGKMSGWILMQQLRQLGVQAVIVESAEDALQELQDTVDRDEPYQIAIVHQHAPVIDGERIAAEIRKHKELGQMPLVMLAADGQRGDAECFEQAGYAAYLVKPVSSNTLQDTLAAALGRQSSDSLEPHIITRHTVDESRQQESGSQTQYKGRVLLAEDVLLNQKVATSMLHQLGMEVEIAENGQQTVQKWLEGHYDLIFMDCRMPLMDGYEATHNIRQQESGGRIPIIALTANAFNEERQRCMDAGMDDFISKPYTLGDLETALEKWLPPKPSADVEVESGIQADHVISEEGAAPVNQAFLEQMREMLAEDFEELIPAFTASTQQILDQLSEAVVAKNNKEVERLAHSLKSASANVGADTLSGMAAALELQTGRGEVEDIAGAVAAINTELERVRASLLIQQQA